MSMVLEAVDILPCKAVLLGPPVRLHELEVGKYTIRQMAS